MLLAYADTEITEWSRIVLVKMEERDSLREVRSSFAHSVIKCLKDIQTKIFNRQLNTWRSDKFSLNIFVEVFGILMLIKTVKMNDIVH